MIKPLTSIKVSVVVPAYNVEKTISKTIGSIIQQTHKNLEILVVDDKSTDNTILELKSINDTRIKLIAKEINTGVSDTRNIGVNNATGEVIAFIDGDDYWNKMFIEETLSYMIKNNTVVGGARITKLEGQSSRVVGASTIPLSEGNQVVDYFDIAFKEPVFSMSSIIVNKNTFLEVGGFNKHYYSGEDHEFYAKLALKGEFSLYNQPLAVYNVSPNRVKRPISYPPIIIFLEGIYDSLQEERKEKVLRTINKFKINYTNSLIADGRGKEAMKYLLNHHSILKSIEIRNKYYIFLFLSLLPHVLGKKGLNLLLNIQEFNRRIKIEKKKDFNNNSVF